MPKGPKDPYAIEPRKLPWRIDLMFFPLMKMTRMSRRMKFLRDDEAVNSFLKKFLQK